MSGSEVKHIFVRGEGGSILKLDLPIHEAIAERMAKGYITRVANADGDPYTGMEPQPQPTPAPAVTPAAPAATVPSLPAERPEVSANKATWVGWAVAESARRGQPITPDAAEALTKNDLIERYGTQPTPAPAVTPAAPAAK